MTRCRRQGEVISNSKSDKETGQETEPTAALPVKRIFLAALVLPLKHAAVIGRFALPLLAVLFAEVLWTLFGPEDFEFSVGWFLTFLLWALVFVVTATLATVVCHRVFIRGPESIAGHGLVRWSSRETRFLGWMLVISIQAGLIGIAMALLFFPILVSVMAGGEEPNPIRLAALGSLLLLPVAYVVGRSSIVLPATAIDERPSMPWAWSISKGNGLRLMVLVGLLPILTDFIFELIPAYDSFVYSIFLMVTYLYVLAAEIAILSLSYRELVRDQPAEPAAQ